MRCDQLEIRLNELLDSRDSVDGDVAVTTHAAACPQCAEVLRTYQTLVDVLEGTTPAEKPPAMSRENFGPLVVSTLKRRQQGQKWLYLGAMAAAATLLWAAAIAWRSSPSDSLPTAGQQAFADASDLTAIDMHFAFQATGRHIVAIPDAFRWVAALPEADRLAIRIRPVTQPVWVALRAIRGVWPDSSQPFSPQATETGLNVLPETGLIA